MIHLAQRQVDNSNSITNQRLLWVDWLKGIALIWIFINHAVEAVFGGAYLGNPFYGAC